MNGTELSLFDPPARRLSAMERAVEETIQAKRALGLLTSEHAALVQLARELACAISIGAAHAKTSVPAATQQLRETLAALPSPVVEDSSANSLAAMMRGEPGEDA